MSSFFAWFANRAELVLGILVGGMAAILVGAPNFKKVIPWAKQNGKFFFAGGCGALLGAFFILCLGQNPADAIASLVGAFAGIAAAVGGGLWLWEVQDARGKEEVFEFISSSIALLVVDLTLLRSNVDRYLQHEAADDDVLASVLADRADEVSEAASQCLARVNRYASQMIRLTAVQNMQHGEIERDLRLLRGEISDLAAALRAPMAQLNLTQNEKLAKDVQTRIQRVFDNGWELVPKAMKASVQ